MRLAQHTLFIYSAIASILLFTSGVTLFLKNGNPVMAILFLPTVGYFAYTITRSLLKHEEMPIVPSSKNTIFVISIIFSMLIIGSVYSILSGPTIKKLPQKADWKIVTPVSPTPPYTNETISVLDNEIVNVRQSNSSESAVLTKIKPGASYKILVKEQDWIQIALTATESGWVLRSFIKINSK